MNASVLNEGVVANLAPNLAVMATCL